MQGKIKPIVIKDENGNTKYVLEFNRASAVYAEEIGLTIGEIEKKPFGTLTKLFQCAFRKNHPNVTAEKADEILQEIGGLTTELGQRLVELYGATVNSIMATEDSLKNAKMTVIL